MDRSSSYVQKRLNGKHITCIRSFLTHEKSVTVIIRFKLKLMQKVLIDEWV